MNHAAFLSLLSIATAAPERPASILTIPTPEFGARGPIRVCEQGVAIDVASGEGVHALGPVLRVINDEYLVAIVAAPPGDRMPTRAAPGRIRLAKRLAALRYFGPQPSGTAESSLEPDRVRYVISRDDAGRGTRNIVVGSSAFDGTDKDAAILARLQPVSAGARRCVRPLAFTIAGYGPGLAAAKRAGFEAFELGQRLALYPPSPTVGPGFYCQGGIGFPIEPGETLLRPWRPLPGGTAYLTHDTVTITINAPRAAMAKADPSDIKEHPLGPLHRTRLTYYESRGTGPPYAPPGVREDGSWSVELGEEQNSRGEVSFPASQKTQVGFQFLERLMVVSDQDPRCRPH